MSSSETEPLNNNRKLTTNRHHPATATFRWTTLRRGRQRLPTVHLGGKKPRRGFVLARLCRRLKLKVLKAKYLIMIKKLKKYYDSLVRDVNSVEPFHQRMILEGSFAIPVMGLTFSSSYPTGYLCNY